MTATWERPADERQKRQRLAVGRAARRHHARHRARRAGCPSRSAPARRSACRGTSCPRTRRRRRARARGRGRARTRGRGAPCVPGAAAVRRACRSRSAALRTRRHRATRGRQRRRDLRGAAEARAAHRTRRDSAVAGVLEFGELVADLLELARELGRRAVALGGVLREAALDRPAQRRRHAGVQALERERLVLDDRRERLDGRRAVEEAAPRQHLVEDEAGGELVGAEIERRGRPPARATCSRASR